MVSTPGITTGIKIPILTGPTASGKTSLAIELALSAGDLEIINADSMLVYRGMDIGTAKPSLKDRKRVPHHLIDIRNPDEPFTAGDFVKAAHEAIEDIHRRGKRALIVGGTGFYLKALLYGLWEAPAADPDLRAKLEHESNESLFRQLVRRDPHSAERIGGSDRYRLIRALEIITLTGKTPTELQTDQSREPDPRFLLWVIDRPDSELLERIIQRTKMMLDQGLIEEVKSIQEQYPSARALSAVGYTQVCRYLSGELPAGRKVKPGLDGLRDEIVLATKQLVKRQRTWFRGQKTARWFMLDKDRTEIAGLMRLP